MLCSCWVFPADLRPGTGAGSRLCCHLVLGVMIPHPGQGLCSGFHIHGKQLSFHLSRFLNKLTRSRSSWPGLCHTLAGPWPLLPASRVLREGSGQHREMLCPPESSGLAMLLW